MEQEPSSPGLIDSVRRMADTALKVVRNRLELFAVEVQEEKCRALQLLAFTLAGLFFGVLATVMITLAIVLAFPENAWTICFIFFVLYAIACVALLMTVRNRLKDRPTPFTGTLDELKKDCEWLQKKN